MKAVVLAAGYATRLYPLTLDKPKALLEIAGKPILDYIIEKIEEIDDVNEIIVISNHRFYQDFMDWASKCECQKPLKILDDGTESEESKLGAIGDISFAIDREGIDEDITVIAGDNLFTYSLKDFHRFFIERGSDCVAVKRIERSEDLKRMGVVLIDEKSRIIDFEEKPAKPKSNIAVFAAYMYRRETLPLIKEYLAGGNNPDAPGHFPAWLHKRKDVFAYEFEGLCFDIGTAESYNEVRELFENMKYK